MTWMVRRIWRASWQNRACPATRRRRFRRCGNREDELSLLRSVVGIACLSAAVSLGGCARKDSAMEERARTAGGASSLVERVGSTGFLQLEADSFSKLTAREQALAYWLSQASIAVDPIIYDQLSRYGLREKRLLEALVSHPEGIKPEVMAKIVAFTKLFWGNKGNHNDTTAQKFLPDFTFEELQEAGAQAMRNGLHIGDPYGTGKPINTEADFVAEITELKPAL